MNAPAMTDILERLYAVPETGADPELIEAAAKEIERLRAENERLRAEVEAMRRQVPVAWFEKSSDLDAWFLAYSCNPKAETKPLYLAPGAQTAHEPSAAAIEHALKAANCFTATWSDAQAAPNVPEGWRPIETAPKDGTHVLLTNKTGTRVADGMYGNYKVWSWPYVMVEPAYWRPMPAAPGAQETNNAI